MNKLPIALGLSLLFAIAGCSSSSSGSGPAPTAPATTPSSSAPVGAVGTAGIAAAKAQITKNWAIFFKSATPHSTAVTLLEDGNTLGPAVADAAKIAKVSGTKESAKVTKITFPTPTTATVIYTLFGNGTALLKNSDGAAVFDNGTWKVSKITFCTLVSLGASEIHLKKVPGC
jgi:hypothetical protein